MRVSVLLVAVLGCSAPAAVPDAQRCDGQPLVAGDAVDGPAGARVTLVALEPAPPARFTNRWTVTALDPEGAAAAAAGVTVTTFMPAHGHAGPAVTVTDDGAGAGVLAAAPIELWMPGTWQVDFHVAGATGTDLVRFEACVDE